MTEPTSATEPAPPEPRVIFEGELRSGRPVRIVAIPMERRLIVELRSRDGLGTPTWRAYRFDAAGLEVVEALLAPHVDQVAEEVERYRHAMNAWARTLDPEASAR